MTKTLMTKTMQKLIKMMQRKKDNMMRIMTTLMMIMVTRYHMYNYSLSKGLSNPVNMTLSAKQCKLYIDYLFCSSVDSLSDIWNSPLFELVLSSPEKSP